MNIEQLTRNYTHPTGVTGYKFGLFEDGELIVVSSQREDLEQIKKMAEGKVK